VNQANALERYALKHRKITKTPLSVKNLEAYKVA